MKTILVPIDFSKATKGVIEAATTLASTMNARIVLLHVVQPLIITSDYGLTMENFQETIASSEKHATRRLAEISEELRSRGLQHVQTVQISGPAQTGILAEAQTHNADYIVMGSHGHTAFYDLLIGSTTQTVLRKAACPVVIVPRAR
ncbi:universal stress protein A [Ereboglobus sp. PH5-5]|uniref:universal stress protein n=1 Tax=unclassified Ereboglobus TaxID=2626932 RepID=UPI002405FE9D|nr:MULTISPECIES: universal stress protein [unclassified Ereboglobus]MDF9827823.1 universal stress protein A [Ereboglobus sp. PH5-10]MDF9833563.1 universal stress protein A [Ereboglobus sp. PH5-5]